LTDVKIPAREIYFPAQESPISCAGNYFFCARNSNFLRRKKNPLRRKFCFPAQEIRPRNSVTVSLWVYEKLVVKEKANEVSVDMASPTFAEDLLLIEIAILSPITNERRSGTDRSGCI
jgi:hypothetical protein